ncbi:MAG: folate-binding protein [Cyanobacteriota bacterium]|nr:folate-binding protein [Cyanobacteriota bacterium]
MSVSAFATISQTTRLYRPQNVGLLRLAGADRARFLHNQSTQQIQALEPGQWTETVFVTSTGRTLDLATLLVTESALWLRISPQRREFLLQWLDRYIFPLDKVAVADGSGEYGVLTVIGPASAEWLAPLGAVWPAPQTFLTWRWLDAELYLSPETGLDLPGFTLWYPREIHSPLLEVLAPLSSLDEEEWETLRIYQGRPAPERELTEDYNPLEAGLWRAVSFAKGCYIGQETIARLNTYKGVKQRLWGLDFAAPVTAGTPLTIAGEKAGLITSAVGKRALGYLKTKAGGAGAAVYAGEIEGVVVPAPYLRHEYFQPASS